jgi:hypothetical protein
MISGSECSQCGMIHPPLAAGKVCPNARTVDENTGVVIDFNALFIPLKNIITSQIQTKEIKDHGKMFGQIIVEMTKMIENYKE